MLTLMLSAFAFADSVNWSMMEPYLEAMGVTGAFVDIDVLGLKMFLPSDMYELEVAEEDMEQGLIALYANADQTRAIGVNLYEVGMTEDEYVSYLIDAGVIDLSREETNGIPVITYVYYNGDYRVNVVSIPLGDYVEEFAFASDYNDFEQMAGLIACSIMFQ